MNPQHPSLAAPFSSAAGGPVLRLSFSLGPTGAFWDYYVTVNSNLRATSGMWNGARTLQMIWHGGQVTNFAPVQLASGLEMRDVWRSVGSTSYLFHG